MDEVRKYKQRGYMDSYTDSGPARDRDQAPKQRGPRPPLDVTGPRLPRLVQTVTASRCYNCAVTLPSDTSFDVACPKCGVALHCCKQCAHFDTSTRFQCRKPIPERIPVKDAANQCSFFAPRVTVAREATSTGPAIVKSVPEPRSPSDARAAFDNLFKK